MITRTRTTSQMHKIRHLLFVSNFPYHISLILIFIIQNQIFMNKKHSKKKGFTLIELLVVITIIGILAGIAFVGFGDVFGTAGRTAAQKNLKTIYESLVTNSQFSFPMSDDVSSSADFAIWYRKKTNDTRPELWFLPDDERVRDLIR